MNGSKILSNNMKREMLQDSRDKQRAKAFREARTRSEKCSLDEYIDFLSEAMEYVDYEPSGKNTRHYRL